MTRNYLDILAESIRNNWNQPALTDFYLTDDGKAQDTSRGNHYTYGEMYAEIVCIADFLTQLGLQKGDHIAICGANSAHWAIAYLAIAKMQGVSVTVMHSLQPEEQAHLIDFSDAKALFVDSEIWKELYRPVLDNLSSVIALDDWSVLRGENISLPYREESEVGFPFVDLDNLAMICFTSGTTECPKGVMLSYINVDGNVVSALSTYPDDKNEHAIALFPFCHMLSIVCEVLAQLIMGKLINIVRNPLTYITIVQGLLIIRPYAFCGVSIILRKLYEQYYPVLNSYMTRTCKLILVGGSPMPIEIEKEIISKGWPLAIGYGQTETGGCISLSNSIFHKKGSCGKVTKELQYKNVKNEICVKGTKVMLGYYKDPEATAQKIDKDGWLHTGDRGHLDEDGYLYVEGRLEQDMIVLPNGENIRPDNIESLINALPEVSESIVLARDGKLVAIVVPKEPIDRKDILRAINPQLPLFSQLYDVEITDQALARTEKQTLKRYLYK